MRTVTVNQDNVDNIINDSELTTDQWASLSNYLSDGRDHVVSYGEHGLHLGGFDESFLKTYNNRVTPW